MNKKLNTPIKLPFITLLLLISFASVNAVLFTPALPDIAHFFGITDDTAQQTMTWFLVGYTLGQLVYGPIANRYGRKPALYAGIILQIISSLLCIASGVFHEYGLLVVARFLLALGSGVGLKMTFTLINECYEPQTASQKISYLMLAFAITPGLGVAIGGVLNSYYGWASCFYAGAVYGFMLLLLVRRLPETQERLNFNALKIKHLVHCYGSQFKNIPLIAGGLLMGTATCFVYVFAAVTPFVAVTIFGLTSSQYGFANLFPPVGLITGSLIGANLAKKYKLELLIYVGILIAGLGTLLMFLALFMNASVLISLFLPMIIIYFGLCFILANASTIAMSHVHDKAHGSAVMNFMNMGLATLVVLSSSLLPMSAFLLPIIYTGLCAVGMGLFICLIRAQK